ncbi:hypothetical protein QKU48_gp1020 [Fadolivirus algeromassiliense]|jgi:hypothetical protein|uniref:Uncharacterized protein n=1 Tax=Fadolivirus FV1/VV64 TaxID=3070911 RepID=A0A7D3R2G1_9VIRU|nr:hypothetical protein QKU48_gp1020 [Fadolivirus algeromassiliense]QKF94478.1 hypothetical protein Fadolivirus_1_1020 [Fadolivirus FV1/VV64]
MVFRLLYILESKSYLRDGCVKCGFTSKYPSQRKKTIQTGIPSKLKYVKLYYIIGLKNKWNLKDLEQEFFRVVDNFHYDDDTFDESDNHYGEFFKTEIIDRADDCIKKLCNEGIILGFKKFDGADCEKDCMDYLLELENDHREDGDDDDDSDYDDSSESYNSDQESDDE